jgi:hypothetical protein
VIETLFCPHHRRVLRPPCRAACLEPPWNTGPSRRGSVRARRCDRPNAGRRGPVCRVAGRAPCRFAGLGSNFYSRVCLLRFCIFFCFLLQGAFGPDAREHPPRREAFLLQGAFGPGRRRGTALSWQK